MTFTSEKAVDGCINQNFGNKCCIHTQANPSLLEAWWQINLGGPVVMELVKIYNRNDVAKERSSRFGGFQIYLSNTTDWRNGDNCHTDTTSTWQSMDLAPSIQSCTGNTIYLTIYVDRRPNKRFDWYSGYAILELCEVEIYGCPLRKFGNNSCDSNCDTTCFNNLCHPNTGRCTSCVKGNYGSFCDNTCPVNCKDGVCDQHTGECEDCVDGYHGRKCDQRCSDHCKGNVCNQGNGTCRGCVLGYFGSTCDQTCPSNCNVNLCVQANGVCIG
ncbi:multiple epidermal growth factor-like domains protein 10 [Ylistrum balloti]|uniref:multiple epidermal growth factor-like domains protein 10 n=1 Tax=Ylistrum balloti TaxID=509963 RepID=UPI002905AB7F|nr:multiple epidermal growth factor-like domains protein 10 [Ylistrum balloti]